MQAIMIEAGVPEPEAALHRRKRRPAKRRHPTRTRSRFDFRQGRLSEPSELGSIDPIARECRAFEILAVLVSSTGSSKQAVGPTASINHEFHRSMHRPKHASDH